MICVTRVVSRVTRLAWWWTSDSMTWCVDCGLSFGSCVTRVTSVRTLLSFLVT